MSLINGNTDDIIKSNVQTLMNQGFDERTAIQKAVEMARMQATDDKKPAAPASGLDQLQQVVADSQKANEQRDKQQGTPPAPAAPAVDTSGAGAFIQSLLARLKYAVAGPDQPAPPPQKQ